MATKSVGNVNIDQKMRERGYLTAKEVSQRTGKDISTVYRWLDNGEVVGEEVLGHRYINLRSLIDKVGIQGSVLLGLISQEQADKIVKEQKQGKKE